MHARDKRKWFAVNFGRSYFKSPPLISPFVAIGLILPIAILAAICVMGFLSHPGYVLAVSPLVICMARVDELQNEVNLRMTELENVNKKAKDENRLMNDDEKARHAAITKEVRGLIEERNLKQDEAETLDKLNTSFRPPIKPSLQPAEDELQKRYAGMPPKEDRFGNLGEFVADVIKAESRMGGIISRKLQRSLGMNESSPTDGGFFVQPDQSARLIEPLFDTQAGDAILSRLNTTNVTGNGLTVNAIDETSRATTNWGGIVMYWLGEGSLKLPTSPKLRKIELKLKKIAGLCYLTDELMEDAPALSSRLERGFQIALRSALIRAIIGGTGAGQPLGLLNSPARITVGASGGSATIVSDDIVNMFVHLDPNAVNPVWLYNRTCYGQLYKLQVALGAAGALVNMPSAGLASAPNTTLVGLPLIACPWCGPLGTEGDLILVDLGQYEFISKGGAQVAYSIHIKFLYDETAMRIVYRCDGQPAVVSATTLEDGQSTVSPIVTLATRP